jgi:hypothetical protein
VCAVFGSFISWKIRCAVFGSFKSWVSIRSATCRGKGVESQDASDGASCQELVVRVWLAAANATPEGRLRTSAAIAALCDASRRCSIT